MIDTTLELALDFLRAHPQWYIFPITRLEKFPPLIKDNLNLASNDPKQIREWHTRFRGCNWGLSLRKSKVIVVDVDTKQGKRGQQTLDDITLEYGELPETLTVRTPSGGFHYYFEGEHRFGLGKYGFGPDVDSPNYVLLPGCWLCSNSEQGYDIVVDAPAAQSPDWFGVFLKDKAEKEAVSEEPVVDLDRDPNLARMILYLKEGAPKCIAGQGGNKTLFDIACVLKDNAVSEMQAVDILNRYYNTPEHCDPLWEVNVGPEKDRLDIVVGNAYRYGKENQAGTATAEYAFGDPDDAYDPKEIKTFVKQWDKRLREQTKDKDDRRVKNRKETLFTDEALDIDPLTGEPVEGNVVIDPLTGEPFQGMGGDDDPTPATPSPRPPRGDGPADDAPKGDETPTDDGGTPKSKQNLLWIQANWVWIVSAERFMRLRDGAMWNTKQFDSYYNNLTDKTSMSSSLFKSDGIRKVEKYVYRPGRGVMLDGGKIVNLWRPPTIKPKDCNPLVRWKSKDELTGEYEPKEAYALDVWHEHIEYLFSRDAQGNKRNSDDANHVLNWMAWVYQNIQRKPNHGLLLVGRNTGTGKSFIARVLEQLIGPENTQRPKNSSLKGDFNAWANSCKLCIIEELMQIGRREVANELRDTITESTIEVNMKNITAQKIENYMAMLAITNHRDAMPMEETERRWLVIETFAERQDGEYYKKLWPILDSPDALAAIAYELQTRELGDYDASLSPQETGARSQMIELSRSDVEQWLIEHSENAPLSNSLTTLTDVVEAMPTTMQRNTRLRTTIQTYMRDKLRGEQLRAIRLSSGSRARLWALNGKGTILSQYTDDRLKVLYENERRQGGSARTPEEQAAEDFEN